MKENEVLEGISFDKKVTDIYYTVIKKMLGPEISQLEKVKLIVAGHFALQERFEDKKANVTLGNTMSRKGRAIEKYIINSLSQGEVNKLVAKYIGGK